MDDRSFPLLLILLGLLILIEGAAACAPFGVSPTSSPEPATATSPPPTDTPVPSAPTSTEEPAQTEAPPTPTPTGEPSPGEPVALFAAGPSDDALLHALAADGTVTDLDHPVHPRAVISDDGRWLATPSGLPVDALLVVDLDTDVTRTIPISSDFQPYGAAFDTATRRLAFLELGAPGEDGVPWAIVVVALEDGATRRFEATADLDEAILPGSPLGWSDDELLLDTFIPYSEAGAEGLWAVTLPADAASQPFDDLDRRLLLPGDGYLLAPEFSPDASGILYLNRDYDYTPDDYGPVGYDLAVNQLGLVDVTDGSSELLVEETGGGALGGDVAWSPAGDRGLFARGTYSGTTFSSLALGTVDQTGGVTDVGPVPLPPEGFLVSLDWCAEDTALVVVATGDGVDQLHTIDLGSAEASLVASDDDITVLGCVPPGETESANADVVHVRAVEAEDGSWTFHVTVEHPDTGWEDYADGWDVVTPDGQVLKPDPEGEFTRTLLHPHVDEQPFTRSQSGIVIPEGVTTVRVRAHDIVDGFGGKEVVVDLTETSGPDFEVERQ